MAALSTGLLALGIGNTFANVRSGLDQARIVSAEGKYQAQVLGVNAKLAEAQAVDAVARGHEAAMKLRTGARAVTGAQIGSAAAQGIELGGSMADVTAQTELLSELDALTIENNAAREAFGYHVQAKNYLAQAAMARAAGRNQAQAIRRSLPGTLLEGALETYGMYSQFRDGGKKKKTEKKP